MFDEQPDGDPHGECAAEIHNLRHLLGQCYAKLMKFGVENSDPFLMDELKLTLMQCYDEPAVSPAPTFARTASIAVSAAYLLSGTCH